MEYGIAVEQLSKYFLLLPGTSFPFLQGLLARVLWSFVCFLSLDNVFTSTTHAISFLTIGNELRMRGSEIATYLWMEPKVQCHLHTINDY